MIIDANNLIVGRFATIAAKKSLLGEKVFILNCENAVISGNKYSLFEQFHTQKNRGTFKGPFLPKMPDRFVKRMIRGMLPYKQEKGRKAFQNIKCYIGVPAEFKDKEPVKMDQANADNLNSERYIYVKDICKNLGAKI
jgi:large subunit ribosomal protein L13